MQSRRLQRAHGAHRIRSSSGKVKVTAWGCPTGRTGEPGEEDSPEEGEGEGVRTRAAKKEKAGMERVRVTEVKGRRSWPPVGWAGLKASRSSS